MDVVGGDTRSDSSARTVSVDAARSRCCARTAAAGPSSACCWAPPGSTSAITEQVYTSVFEDVEREAAEQAAALVPLAHLRAHRRAVWAPSGSLQGTNRSPG